MAAMGLDDFSRVISLLGAAASGDDTSWYDVMSELTTCLGATAATVVLGTGPTRTVLASTLATEATSPYLQHYRRMDFVMAACDSSPVGLVHGGWNLVRAHAGTEFHHDWQRPFDITDGLAVRLATPQPSSFVVSAPRRGEPFATTERTRFVDALVPHLQRALIAHQIHMDDTDTAGGTPRTSTGLHGELGAAANAVRHALLTTDGHGTVKGLNTAAANLLAAGDGLTLRARTLHASSPAVHAALHIAISSSASPPYPVSAHVVCPRPSGRRPYVIQATPVTTDDGAHRARAAVIIVDPEAHPTPPETLLRTMFGLTPAESAVAAHLCSGATVTEIADTSSVSVATIKTHMHHLYRKTHTTRQAQLVALLLSLRH